MRSNRPVRVVNFKSRCHGWKRIISRLGRQPRQRRQLRCRWPQRQQQLGQQPQRQHRVVRLSAVIALSK